ncbi:Nitrilase [Purpureocillium takamizusanense]|uniref:Nitrilase n=1 Tax=Purpureocillium takamizusanense TaxID=2060973 RepID=A0A9Q8QNZ9_9HYPO|nr:Nitrilase [Purpureocillium takamizusanense]UNI24744.1 Nitrilase [Purpureocillium takamizusanense]
MASTTTTTIRVATASPATGPSRAATLAHLEALARRAAPADLLLLPEAYIGGYPRGSAFGCVVGDRSAAGRDEYARYYDAAVDLGDTVGEGGAGAGDRWVRRELASVAARDPKTAVVDDAATTSGGASLPPARGDGTREELERIARDTGVFVVTGLIEKAGGSLYCAVVYVCPREGIIGKRRKVLPTGTERLVWAQGSPATLRAVSTTLRGVRVNLAAAICWENYMPLLRQSLYAQNVNLYLAPTADGRDAWLGLMRTVGVEGRCFVVSSNMCVRSADGPPSSQQQQQQQQQASHAQTHRVPPPPAARRNSTITEEGFEIALPHSSSSTSTSPQQRHHPQHKRRKSVFDEDGNEIVLCCDADDNDDAVAGDLNGAGAKHVNGTSSATLTTTTATNGTTTMTGGGSGGSTSFSSRGGSCIVSPFGDVLAGPQWEDDEGIIYADIDLRDCIRGRLDLDAAGSYSRNDSFTLTVRGLDLDPLPY